MVKLKKGTIAFPQARLAALLLLVLFIILFFPIIDSVTNWITGQGNAAACATALFTGGSAIGCPLDEVKIFRDKVEINDNEFMVRGTRTTEEMAKDALAKLLQRCLSRGGGYNSRAFKRQGYYDNSMYVCMECFHVTISEGITDDITGLTDYIKDNKPRGSSDKTYLEILTKDENHLEKYGTAASALKEHHDVIVSPYHRDDTELIFTPSEDYTVFFLAWGQSRYFSFISRTNELSRACEVKVN